MSVSRQRGFPVLLGCSFCTSATRNSPLSKVVFGRARVFEPIASAGVAPPLVGWLWAPWLELMEIAFCFIFHNQVEVEYPSGHRRLDTPVQSTWRARSRKQGTAKTVRRAETHERSNATGQIATNRIQRIWGELTGPDGQAQLHEQTKVPVSDRPLFAWCMRRRRCSRRG